MGTPPRGQTNKVKVLPSHRTTYAGGNKLQISRNIFAFVRCEWALRLKAHMI